ncbi:MAG: hypothetical protein FJ206_07215 [Gemmatimonadetes bacterium]|nr:hypothetical protein [Gemmatimonadota bacterium]
MRAQQEFAPGGLTPEAADGLGTAIAEAKLNAALIKKQKDNGLWGGNLLALAPSAKDGIKDIGTVPQYRRLVQLGVPKTGRAFKLAERVLFRLLSRDEDPFLQFEFARLAKEGGTVMEWAREHMREAATAALAEAGYLEDPRIRGAAHRVASNVSAFLRSPTADKPFVRSGAKTILDPEAHPPTWYSVAMIAALPNLQRERAGFTERLGQYLSAPAPKKAFVVQAGKKSIKPDYLLLGDPIEADSKGNAKDIPVALYVIELLARLGALHTAPVATKVLIRLLGDCDGNGVWLPKGLKSLPKASHKATYHWYPLNPETKAPESRSVDITFRLALVAKLLGWHLEIR